jgi:hypothetical protein
MKWMMTGAAALVAAAVGGGARADDKPAGPPATVWTVLGKGGAAEGTETMRIVRRDGEVFASGEVKRGKKGAVRTHVRRKADGALAKYERIDGSVKGPGARVYEFEGRMRHASVNGSGKPVDLESPIQGALWDPAAWHLLALWSWPEECKSSASLGIWSLERKAAGRAELACEAGRKVKNASGEAVAVHSWKVSLGGTALTVLVDKAGQVVAAEGDGRSMLLAKWASDAGAAAVPAEAGEAGEAEELKERGAGP